MKRVHKRKSSSLLPYKRYIARTSRHFYGPADPTYCENKYPIDNLQSCKKGSKRCAADLASVLQKREMCKRYGRITTVPSVSKMLSREFAPLLVNRGDAAKKSPWTSQHRSSTAPAGSGREEELTPQQTLFALMMNRNLNRTAVKMDLNDVSLSAAKEDAAKAADVPNPADVMAMLPNRLLKQYDIDNQENAMRARMNESLKYAHSDANRVVVTVHLNKAAVNGPSFKDDKVIFHLERIQPVEAILGLIDSHLDAILDVTALQRFCTITGAASLVDSETRRRELKKGLPKWALSQTQETISAIATKRVGGQDIPLSSSDNRYFVAEYAKGMNILREINSGKSEMGQGRLHAPLPMRKDPKTNERTGGYHGYTIPKSTGLTGRDYIQQGCVASPYVSDELRAATIKRAQNLTVADQINVKQMYDLARIMDSMSSEEVLSKTVFGHIADKWLELQRNKANGDANVKEETILLLETLAYKVLLLMLHAPIAKPGTFIDFWPLFRRALYVDERVDTNYKTLLGSETSDAIAELLKQNDDDDTSSSDSDSSDSDSSDSDGDGVNETKKRKRRSKKPKLTHAERRRLKKLVEADEILAANGKPSLRKLALYEACKKSKRSKNCKQAKKWEMDAELDDLF
jgi:hypothetical protein